MSDGLRRQVVGRQVVSPRDVLSDDLSPFGVSQHRVSLKSRSGEKKAHPLPVLRYGGIVEGVEVEYRSLYRLVDVDVARHGIEDLAKIFEARVELAPGNVVFRGVIPEQRSPSNAGRAGDVLDRGRFETAFGEEGESGALDRGMVGDGRPAEVMLVPRFHKVVNLAPFRFGARCH